MKLSQLKLNEENPRKISAEKLEKLMDSISQDPDYTDKHMRKRGIIVNKENVILAGNMRFKAFKKLGMKEIPDEWVQDGSDFTPEQMERFIVEDNLEFGEDDWGKLSKWDQEKLKKWGMELPAITRETKDDDFDLEGALEKIEEPNSKTGDVFQLGKHRLMCGDATKVEDIEKLMGGASADMVFTDPPYNVDYEGGNGQKIQNDKQDDQSFLQFLTDAFVGMAQFIKSGAAVYVCHADSEGYNFRKAFKDAGFLLRQCIIWNKNTFVMGRQDYHWKHEPILYGWKDGGKHSFFGGRNQSTVWDFDKPKRNAEHPTMKPIPLVGRAISNSSKGDDIILDTFMGGGSTLIACEQTGRISYGLELDPKYVDVCIARWEKFTGGKAVKL